jgi:DNA-binding NarL/FixJ family response regulator
MPPFPSSFQSLTPRERQVAALICQGFTNHQIARQLSISPETVKSHASNILHKLGHPRRSSLRAAYFGQDFIPGA